MEIPEANRHRIRGQLIKIIAHLHKARHEINHCELHAKMVRNAKDIDGIATLQLDFKGWLYLLDVIQAQIDSSIGEAAHMAFKIKEIMVQPHNSPPPLYGRHTQLDNLTPIQRILVREGKLNLEPTVPTHFHIIPNTTKPKPKSRKLPPPLPKRKRRKPDNRMPI